MTEVVVAVGPWTVVGANPVDIEWVSLALECIDDDMALMDDRPVAVDDVWQEVLFVAAGDGVDTLVLVCPAWWSSSRIERVRVAAKSAAQTVVVLQRAHVLRTGIATRQAAVVEIAPEFVVVTRPSASSYVPHSEGPDAVVAAVGAAEAVVLDAPDWVGTAGALGTAEALGAAIGSRLRAAGVAVTLADGESLRSAAVALRARSHGQLAGPDGRSQLNRRSAVLAGMVSVVALCGGFAVHVGNAPSHGVPMAFLTEGRIAVMVPVEWAVERVTSGPGSARLRLVSPSEPDLALHITHANGATQADVMTTAQSLRAALDDEPEGVFVDFNPSDRRLGRDAVTYREVRGDRQVEWAVVVEDSVRIAIGCQSAPGRAGSVREICDEAIRSARALR